MTRKDALVNLRQTLIKRRDALRQALVRDNFSEQNRQSAGDLIDAALDSAHNEISSQLAEVESRELASIEAALEKMRTGSYGVCENCGGRISSARMNALPYATSCIECQREMEREGTAAGLPVDWSRLLDSVDDFDVSINDLEVDAS